MSPPARALPPRGARRDAPAPLSASRSQPSASSKRWCATASRRAHSPRLQRWLVGGALLAAAVGAACAPPADREAHLRDTVAIRGQEQPVLRGAVGNLVANGDFAEWPNPFVSWTNAPGAFVTWLEQGANASPGAAHLRFFPPPRRGDAARGAIYYTGLSQCIPIPRPGRYLLRAYARVPEAASASSRAGLGWTLRYAAADCGGASNGNGSLDFVRSGTWVASSTASIQVREEFWSAGTTIELALQVGDSSTTSIESVEAVLDAITLIEGPLFQDGFED